MPTTNFDQAAIATIAAFGEACIYTPLATGAAIAVNAVFDRPFLELDMLNAPGVIEATIFATIRIADLGGPEPKQGDGFRARGINFAVREPRPDGQGMARLLLARA